MKWLRIFPPLSHGWCRKKIVPTLPREVSWIWICVVSTGAIISLGRHEPFEARDRKQLTTEPEQNSGNQCAISPLQLKRDFQFLPQLPNLSLERQPSHVFSGNKVPLKAALWMSPVTTSRYFEILVNNFLDHMQPLSLPPWRLISVCNTSVVRWALEERTQDLYFSRHAS